MHDRQQDLDQGGLDPGGGRLRQDLVGGPGDPQPAVDDADSEEEDGQEGHAEGGDQEPSNPGVTGAHSGGRF